MNADRSHLFECADGRAVWIRPIQPDDATALYQFHHGLSRRTSYLRYFGIHPELSVAEVQHFTCVDYVTRFALVAEYEGQLVAVGRYDRLPGTADAEVAFVVADDFQHHGIGTELLDELAVAAWRRGITAFTATTLAENRTMLDVFRHCGFPVTSELDHETVSLRFSIRPEDRTPGAEQGSADEGCSPASRSGTVTGPC